MPTITFKTKACFTKTYYYVTRKLMYQVELKEIIVDKHFRHWLVFVNIDMDICAKINGKVFNDKFDQIEADFGIFTCYRIASEYMHLLEGKETIREKKLRLKTNNPYYLSPKGEKELLEMRKKEFK